MPRKKERAETDRQFACPNSECGLVFSKPLKVKNLSAERSEVYDACPRCLTALIVEETAPVFEGKQSLNLDVSETVENVPSQEGKRAKSSPEIHCAHHFGYLSERRRNEKIPDECVVCGKIVECMLKSVTG